MSTVILDLASLFLSPTNWLIPMCVWTTEKASVLPGKPPSFPTPNKTKQNKNKPKQNKKTPCPHLCYSTVLSLCIYVSFTQLELFFAQGEMRLRNEP